MPFAAAKACWPRTARWSSRPASTPAAARKDKFIVRDADDRETRSGGARSTSRWTRRAFDRAARPISCAALDGQGRAFVADLYGGSQPEHRVNVRVINELAWHNLFIRTLLVRPEADELAGFAPEYTIIDLPSFRADPERHGCRSETVIAVNLDREADPDRRHRICRRDEEVGVRPAELPAPAAGHHADALLGQHRRRTATPRSSSAFRAPARRRCRPTPTAR